MLAGGEGAAADAVDEHLDPRLAVRRRRAAYDWPRPRRRRWPAPARAPRNAPLGEGEAELRQRLRPFVAAVRHGAQIGDGQMAAAVAACRARARRSPHWPPTSPRRRRRRRAAHRRCVDRRSPSAASQARFGRGCGSKTPWARPSPRLARIFSTPCSAAARGKSDLAGIGGRGEVAEAEPGIIVARPDDAVEIDLAERHHLGARWRAAGRRARPRAARRRRRSSVAPVLAATSRPSRSSRRNRAAAPAASSIFLPTVAVADPRTAPVARLADGADLVGRARTWSGRRRKCRHSLRREAFLLEHPHRRAAGRMRQAA